MQLYPSTAKIAIPAGFCYYNQMDFLVDPFVAVVTRGSSPYCETPVSYWLNIVSNAAHFAAAYFAFRYLRTNRIKSKLFFALVALLFFLGIGSTLWHAFPMPLTDFTDSFPSGLFVFLITLALFEKVVPYRSLALGVLFLITMLIIFLEPLHLLHGSFVYIVILGVLAGILIKLKQKYPEVSSLWILVLALFGVAIFFRTIDFVTCDLFGFGTHFVWHMLAAVAAYFGIRFLAKGVS